MNNKLIAYSIPLLLALSGCAEKTAAVAESGLKQPAQQLKVTYPVTKKGNVVDSYFTQQVADPYRWLEDDMSEETVSWVKAQNKVTFDYLAKIPYREQLKSSLKALMDYEKVSAPFKEGKYSYFYKNDGLQNQKVVYRQLDDGLEEVFLDPNKLSADGTTSMSGLTFSKDGSLAAYQLSNGGSDWRQVVIIDVETKKQLEAPLADVKFSGISWLGNEGFYYSSYDKPQGSVLSAKTDQHKLYYHQLGTAQTSDQLIYGGSAAERHRYVYGEVTDDKRYLLISAQTSTSGNKLFLKDLTKPISKLVTIVGDTNSDIELLDSKDNQLYFITNRNAPNKKVVRVAANNPAPAHWQDVIPHTKDVLSVVSGGGYFFARYMVDAISKVQQFTMAGQFVREIELPGPGTASGFAGKEQQTTLYYAFTNYKTPKTIFSLDVKTGNSAVYRESAAKFNSDNYLTKQVFYTSKDGTKVPMIITHKKGIKLTANNPTILYGYGGFNISLTPKFRPDTAAWLEQGGIYAVANLRGGGEYGKNWHDAGTQLKKQNVFDDFISAAQYLIAQQYTSSDYLAIRGG